MIKKLAGFLLTGALALSLAACGPAGEVPGGSPSPTEEAPGVSASPAPPESPEPSAEPSSAASPSPSPGQSAAPAGYDLPARDYQPWQAAYMDFLAGLQAQEWADASAYAALSEAEQAQQEGQALWSAVSDSSESYSLYDVDQDGVPELFVKFGNCEAAYHTRCYTFRGGEVALAGEFGSGHSSLYTCPDRSAVLVYYAHMGWSQMQEYTMENGTLTAGQELLSEEEAIEYIQPEEIVPGAVYIDFFYTKLGELLADQSGRPQPSGGEALLLPVCDWQAGPAPTGSSSEAARAAILAVLGGEAELYGASGDHFYGDVGRTTWEAYIQPGAAYPFNHTPFQILQHLWMDLNGDGQEECVLQLQSEAGTAVVVLSAQEDRVYAYYFGFFGDTAACADGAILDVYGKTVRLSFWKDQCYGYYAQPDAGAQPAAWVEGAPES